jgi:AAA+ superfamily predicted ATPase
MSVDPSPADATPTGWRALGTALLERELAPGPAAEAALARAEQEYDVALAGDDPLAVVAASAELDDLEVRVLAVCAAVADDRRLQRIVARLQHDAAATRVELDLLAALLGPDAVDRLADDAALVRGCLLELEPGDGLADARVVVPRRVSWALRGDVALDPALPLGSEIVVLPADAIGRHDLVLVHGPDRVRRHQVGTAAAGPLVFLTTTPPADDAGWRVLVRFASLHGLGVVLELTAAVDAATRHWVERATHLSFVLSSRQPLDLGVAPDRAYVELAAGPAEVGAEEWSAVFPDTPPPARRPTAEQLALARRVPHQAGLDGQEVMRRVATGTLVAHATRIVPRVGWDELVLPPHHERQLRALVSRYQQRGRVHDDWGLSLYPSPGVVALFSGPSGTGKTTSAEAIAHELGVDMFRVDLSALVSKYIGETEKNLEEIFSAAHTGNYLLLFDEADSLFGSRSKVEDSKDRYANMEVSYLLQRLETYDGFVVLTSNFQGNIDQAFLRRIHVTVSFQIPAADERLRIWERSLAAAPTRDLDLAFVAEGFDLTGGSIRNAALTAAFAAAGDEGDGAVGMVEVLRAVSTEMTKLGRRVNDQQFGRWLEQVRQT